ncbi:kinase-like domain-containing protein [Rhizophagus irregularis DAOM 181602=DAOM 197198]|nr:kinase-like domain-containing protein [Rhizophagus irregularis DAOM 181602=DAOM 197198]
MCLHNSQDITADFLKEVETHILARYTNWIVRCFDPLKRPNSYELQKLFGDLYVKSYLDSVLNEQKKEADEINKKSSSSFSTAQSPLSSTKPKNADSNDDLLGIEYSESIKVDFTKLNINSEDCN